MFLLGLLVMAALFLRDFYKLFFIVGLQFLKCSFTLVNSAFKNLVRLEKSNLYKPLFSKV